MIISTMSFTAWCPLHPSPASIQDRAPCTWALRRDKHVLSLHTAAKMISKFKSDDAIPTRTPCGGSPHTGNKIQMLAGGPSPHRTRAQLPPALCSRSLLSIARAGQALSHLRVLHMLCPLPGLAPPLTACGSCGPSSLSLSVSPQRGLLTTLS